MQIHKGKQCQEYPALQGETFLGNEANWRMFSKRSQCKYAVHSQVLIMLEQPRSPSSTSFTKSGGGIAGFANACEAITNQLSFPPIIVRTDFDIYGHYLLAHFNITGCLSLEGAAPEMADISNAVVVNAWSFGE